LNSGVELSWKTSSSGSISGSDGMSLNISSPSVVSEYNNID